MKRVHWYLMGTGSWFIALGIQTVLFSWLVTMVLRESPTRVGVAQMTMMLPSLFLLLIGGSLADRFGARRMVMLAQSAAAVPPLALAALIGFEALSFPLLLVYAAVFGVAQAFVTPARDGLLTHVAEGRIQHTVLLNSMVQFTVQLFGFGLAAVAGKVGAVVVLLVQSSVMLAGLYAYRRLDDPTLLSAPKGALFGALKASIAEGARVVLRVPAMRAVLLVNCATGLCFMGSFMVALPLLVREVFAGGSVDLAAMNTANVLGLVSTIVVLLRYGDVRRRGRALILAHGVGVFALAALALPMRFPIALLLIFCWGASGGVAMSMARTIMQELANDSVRGRVMAFFSVSLMGAGPIGALVSGTLVKAIGVHATLLTVSIAMALVLIWATVATELWRFDTRAREVRL